jgi:hypothetical protein
VRVLSYKYVFNKKLFGRGPYWIRTFSEEVIPPVHLEDSDFLAELDEMGISVETKSTTSAVSKSA